MSFFSPPKPKSQSTPVTPRLSDAQLTAKEQAGETRRRKGLSDNILSLGRRSSNEQQSASLLGRTTA
jgi:hypothetical protein